MLQKEAFKVFLPISAKKVKPFAGNWLHLLFGFA
jgi:hypothetical protein